MAGIMNADTTLKMKMLSFFQGDKATGSCNELLTGGIYYIQSAVTDKPSGVSGNGIILTLGTSSNYRIQIFTSALSQDYYMRKFIFSEWSAWTKLS